MIIRNTDLDLLMSEFPAVAILGPRQVGKSTLALSAMSSKEIVFLDMELDSHRAMMEDTELFFKSNREKLVIIDEAQQVPKIFSALRPEIDAKRTQGRFILTGSANPSLIKGISESLAGRIAFMPLPPFSLLEIVPKYSLEKHWFRGGFPDAFLAKSDAAWKRWMDNYIESFVQRDLRMLFDVNLSTTLTRNIWSMIAHNNAQILNIETFARALGITNPTVKRYLTFLEGAYLIRLLQPFYVNSNKRLVKSPKIYIRDSGILHYFTNISSYSNLVGNLVVGGSWEGYVVEEICKLLPISVQVYYYRTHHGAEIDLVLVRNNIPILSIEIKHSLSPKIGKGFHAAVEDLATVNNYIIYIGNSSYKTKENYIVVGLQAFLTQHLPKFI